MRSPSDSCSDSSCLDARADACRYGANPGRVISLDLIATSRMDPIQNNPLTFRLAQAYGMRPVRPASLAKPAQPVRPVQPVQPAGLGEIARSTDAAQTAGSRWIGSDTVELSTNVAARERIASLVAARVPGSIDFTLTNEGVMTPGEAGVMKLHHHPADLNIAATGVALGRAIDFEA